MVAAVARATGGDGRIRKSRKTWTDKENLQQLIEEIPVPLSLYPSKLIHSLLQDPIREKLPLWRDGLNRLRQQHQ